MKRFVKYAICLLLVCSLVGCDWQMLLHNAIKGTSSSTESTSTSEQNTTSSIQDATDDNAFNDFLLKDIFPRNNVSLIYLQLSPRDSNLFRKYNNVDVLYERIFNKIVVSNDPAEIERQSKELNLFWSENPQGDPIFGSISYSLIIYDTNNHLIGTIWVFVNNSITVTHYVDDGVINYASLKEHTVSQASVLEIWEEGNCE